jgi:hypothetical protein
MKRLIVSILLLALTPCASSAQLKKYATGKLSLTIATDQPNRLEGEPIPVKIVFKNIGKKRASFVLPYNDRDPPGYIWGRLRDTKGALLTENNTHPGGWYSSWVQWSGFYDENPKDRLWLKPGEEYSRMVNLSALLAGCHCLPNGVRAGTYRVQIALGNIVSNEVEIKVEKPSR